MDPELEFISCTENLVIIKNNVPKKFITVLREFYTVKIVKTIIKISPKNIKKPIALSASSLKKLYVAHDAIDINHLKQNNARERLKLARDILAVGVGGILLHDAIGTRRTSNEKQNDINTNIIKKRFYFIVNRIKDSDPMTFDILMWFAKQNIYILIVQGYPNRIFDSNPQQPTTNLLLFLQEYTLTSGHIFTEFGARSSHIVQILIEKTDLNFKFFNDSVGREQLDLFSQISTRNQNRLFLGVRVDETFWMNQFLYFKREINLEQNLNILKQNYIQQPGFVENSESLCVIL
jgi:hypothetical protein